MWQKNTLLRKLHALLGFNGYRKNRRVPHSEQTAWLKKQPKTNIRFGLFDYGFSN